MSYHRCSRKWRRVVPVTENPVTDVKSMVSVFCWLFGRLIAKTGLFFALLEIVLAFIYFITLIRYNREKTFPRLFSSDFLKILTFIEF